MLINQNHEILAKCLQKCRIEDQTIIVLMLMLKNKPQKMQQVMECLVEQEKNNTIDSDKIAKQVMKIAMKN